MSRLRLFAEKSKGTEESALARPPGAAQTLLANEMRAAFDLSRVPVRIHSDDRAAASAEALGADAYTTGSDVFFGAGRYRPATPAGRHLLLHELAHVVQQQTPGPAASRDALEREADAAAASSLAGRHAQLRLSAPRGRAQHQSMELKTGDVFVNATAATHIKTQGGLFSGNDQAHVNVSQRGKLAYDVRHTAPEDPFRWSRLKEIVDNGHLQIFGVPSGHKFKVRPAPGGPVVERSIDEIRLIEGNQSVVGIHLRAGDLSPDPVYSQIFYDEARGIGALTHELFGHEWLALKGAPSVHPPPNTPAEAARGTLRPAHGIKDPFGVVYAGTVRSYIAKYIEAAATSVSVTTTAGTQTAVPKSPTQQIGVDILNKAFADLDVRVRGGGLTKNTYAAEVAQAWRIICNNYDAMQRNDEARKAGNSNLTYTREIILAVSVLLFRSLTKDQQSGFRILLADFTGSRAKWGGNELSTKLEALVGPAKPVARWD